jgi:hypothetical protein
MTDTAPHLPSAIEHLPTADLIPYARNSRTHSPAQTAAIAASIRQYGFTNPVLIDSNNTIIAGHGRVMAAQTLGLPAVPCIRLSHLTDTQRRAYVIADNKLAEQAGWDMATLAREVEDLMAEAFDMSLLGFTETELADINQAAPQAAPDIQAIQNLETKTQNEDDQNDTDDRQFKKEMANTETPGLLPIVPQYAENHQAFIILCDNKIDEAWIRNRLGLEQIQKSYKDQKALRANIVTVAQLRKAFI